MLTTKSLAFIIFYVMQLFNFNLVSYKERPNFKFWDAKYGKDKW